MKKRGVKMVNHKMMLTLLLFAMTFSGTAFSASRDYPNRQIEVVVPFAPGGTSDLSARIFSDGISKRLGVPIVVSNKAGGSGAAGAEYVANAKPDGYTLLAPSNTVLITLPLTTPTLSYKWTDFTPITRIGRIPFIIVTNGDSPFNSMADIAAFAKKNPGSLIAVLQGQARPTTLISNYGGRRWVSKLALFHTRGARPRFQPNWAVMWISV